MNDSNQSEFLSLVQKHRGIIYKICRSYTKNSDDLQDLFQEIVLQLWNSFDTFQGKSKFSTWMYRVALNTSITLYRKGKRQPELSDTEVSMIRKIEDVDEETQEKVDALYRAIHKLNDIDKALVLLYLDDLPYKEIAETLGISEVNARVKMNRAKQKLKEFIENEE